MGNMKREYRVVVRILWEGRFKKGFGECREGIENLVIKPSLWERISSPLKSVGLLVLVYLCS